MGDAYIFYREASTPSLKKYYKTTLCLLRIINKHRDKIGVLRVIGMSINKLLKLAVYGLYALFGATDKLILRRSVKLEKQEEDRLQSMLNKIV